MGGDDADGGWGGGESHWGDSDDVWGDLWGIPHDHTNGLKPAWNDTILESKGAALRPVQYLIFGAKSRIRWYFSPDKDATVSSLLGWINEMQYTLGELGVSANDIIPGRDLIIHIDAQIPSKQTTRRPVHKRPILPWTATGV